MPGLYGPALIAAFLITTLEMTEVVALVFALGHASGSVSHGAWGAVAGTALVAGAAIVSASAVVTLPHETLLGVSAVVLVAFGVFLFRSTVRSFRHAQAQGAKTPPPVQSRAVPFAGGFSVGVIETFEAVIVLVALAAAGYGSSALVGALGGGALLVALAFLIRGQIRRIKVPWLKLAGTSLLFTFGIFWGAEALGYRWPGDDLALAPLFVAGVLLVRGGVALFQPKHIPVDAKG